VTTDFSLPAAAAPDAGRGLVPADLREQAQKLLDGLLHEPWGQTSPSVYETGRVVSLAPWLTGHEQRLAYLLDSQRPDGGWGAPGGYALVPTLSAVEALLASLHEAGPDRPRLAAAAGRGLRLLADLLTRPDLDIPDMPAADVIAHSLIEAINRHLDRSPQPPPGWPAERRLAAPSGLPADRFVALRRVLGEGADPPEKLLHALEIIELSEPALARVRPDASGSVGAAPAATAAWLARTGRRSPDEPALRFLEAVVSRHRGPVPCGLPITVFERAWVVSILGRAGIAVDPPAEVVASLREALAEGGTPAGGGLPKDADTTSAALYALGFHQPPPAPDPLRPFDLGTHFCTWPGEDGFSVTVNAHVLEAFGHYAAAAPEAPPRYAETVRRLSALLLEHQREDGSWDDRWHASPYYATACCVLALRGFGGAIAAAAVEAATRWVLDTQRPDGSWGRWEGTAEETAYALQILASGDRPREERHMRAIARGRARLLTEIDGSAGFPPLWHDKDLYAPTAIVQANILAALHVSGPLE